uniref:Uncharacterized protein n=1 Tax=Kalanchoe fedtschenkoi TaxID=63787 RepID=A0A7N0TZ65_KALFE
MEEQKLDFNQPVLSVRRFGPTVVEPENKARADFGHGSFPSIPFYKADLKSGPIRNPGMVPFVWEQTPGQPKNDRKSVYKGSGLPPIAPRLPPGRRRDAKEKLELVRSPERPKIDMSQSRNDTSSYTNGKPPDVKTEKLGSGQEGCTKTEGFSSEDDDDDEYVDARDTLSVSRSESLFDNCSLSGVSGVDGSDAILAGTVSADPQTVEFMMGRFLPAAKAMASETPPHSSKKMYAVREQPKQATAAVKAAKRVPGPSPDRTPNLLRHYIQNDVEEDSEDDMDDEDDQSIVSGKGCGLLPRFCLLSPVPGLRILPQTRAKSVRTVPANSFRTPHGIKRASEISSAASHRTTEIREDRSSPSIEPISNENGSSRESKKASNFVSGPKAFKTFQDFLMDQNAEHESPPESPVVEKTLYIDSGHTSVTPSSLTVNAEAKRFTESYNRSPDKTSVSGDVPFSDSLLHVIKHISIADENTSSQARILDPIRSSETIAIVSHQDANLVTDKSSTEDEFSDKGITTSADSKAWKDTNLKSQQLQFVVSKQIPSSGAYPQLPLPPPLPNSPSDSWLCRALPSVASRNLSSRTYQGSHMQVNSKQQAAKQNSGDPKWETMVKTSKPQRGHHRYSEEMLTPIPEV